jgi:hypothetical protein
VAACCVERRSNGAVPACHWTHGLQRGAGALPVCRVNDPRYSLDVIGADPDQASDAALFVEVLRCFVAETPGKCSPQGILPQARLGDPADQASRPSLTEVLGQPPLSYRILDRQTPVGGCAFGDRRVGGFKFLRCGTRACRLVVADIGQLVVRHRAR